jgi:hypothetical protein
MAWSRGGHDREEKGLKKGNILVYHEEHDMFTKKGKGQGKERGK